MKVFLPAIVVAFALLPTTRILAEDVSTSTAEVRESLKSLVPTDNQLQRIATLITQLDDDDFFVREKASQQLEKMSLIPASILAEAMKHSSLEVRSRACRLNFIHTSGRSRAILKEAMHTIVQKKLRGMTPSLLAAMRYHGDESLWELTQKAVLVSAQSEDEPALRDALDSDEAVIRMAAAGALIQLLGKDSNTLLLKLLNDPDQRIRLTAATTLGNQGHRACLPTFAELLRSDSLHVRLAAQGALRSLTQQDFGYDPISDPAARNAVADRWVAWIREHGDTVALKFPIRPNTTIALFNGIDLTGWQVVHPGKAIDHCEDWTVKQGSLRCNGGERGYLRTKNAFTNYVLSLEWRMLSNSCDSGVGLMMGEDSDPSCLEVQIHPENSGDLYRIGNFRFQVEGNAISFRAIKMHPSNEKPLGQWNAMRIVVARGTVEVKINGLLQNKVTGCTTEPGRINLRNEGKPIEFRNIQITPLGK